MMIHTMIMIRGASSSTIALSGTYYIRARSGEDRWRKQRVLLVHLINSVEDRRYSLDVYIHVFAVGEACVQWLALSIEIAISFQDQLSYFTVNNCWGRSQSEYIAVPHFSACDVVVGDTTQPASDV